ncbi:MAG: HAD family phosphatase [Roseibium sp.]
MQQIQTPKLIIFDCDGVLVDSVMAHCDVLSANFAKYGLEISPIDCRDKLGAGKMSEIGKAAQALGASLPDHWIDEIYQEIFSRLKRGVPLIKGIRDVLKSVNAKPIKICVASNGSCEKMEIMLGASGLLGHFDGHIFSAHDLGVWKPEPDLFLHAAKKMHVSPSDCVVIEDSPTGAQAAKRAEMSCLGYAADTHPDELISHGALAFSSMHDLPKLLGI